MPIDTEQWRAQTGLFCASRVLLRPPRCKQPQPKVQADTLSLNMRFTLAVLLVTLRTGLFYASRTLQLLCLIACRASWFLSSIVRLSCRRLRGVSVLLALCLVVVQMLLIMSGDVEENPGPPKIRASSLGVSDLSCVREELLDVSHKWFDIGLKLRLSVGTLECVREQYPAPSTSLREMLLHWLKKVDPTPTWEGLACALESRTVGEPRLAEQLRAKYCKTERAAGLSVGQTATVTEKEQPFRPVHRLLPAASRSYIPRLMTRKGVPAGGFVKHKLQTVPSKERSPHHSRHARVVPPSQRLPSTASHIPHPIARKEVGPLDQQRKLLPVVRGQTPAAHSPIYGPVPSSPTHTPVDRVALSNGRAMSKSQMSWERLLAAINKEFSKEEGEPNIDHLKKCMQAYTSNIADWEKYNLFDPQRLRYTRNLVDEGNGNYNLIVLCWSEGKGSRIHNHANSHCLMKILQGPLKETMFAWPTKSEEGDEYPEQSMQEIRCNIYQTDEVAYINDDFGLQRVENPSHTDGAVSLHLYIPPITVFEVFDDNTALTRTCMMKFDSRDGQQVATD